MAHPLFSTVSVAFQVAIYSGDVATAEQLRTNAAARFGIKLMKDFQVGAVCAVCLLNEPGCVPALRPGLQVVQLSGRQLVEAATYPQFTLIGQALGSIVLAWEALSQLRPQASRPSLPSFLAPRRFH